MATRRRIATTAGMTFILRKSRTGITDENVDVCRVLRLFTETNGLKISDTGRRAVSDFIQERKISRQSLLSPAHFFSSSRHTERPGLQRGDLMPLPDDRALSRQAATATARCFNVDPASVEKDYYLTLFPQQLSERLPELLFKVGTSLSGCCRVVSFFPGDPDITLTEDRVTQGLT